MADVEPLRGVRVLDLTTFLSGPLLARNLADLGAEVIKIEPPTGDPTRPKNGDPFSPLWLNVHRGRRGVVLDLKTQAGRDVLLDLAAQADVLVENYRPGVTTRLGVDAATVRARNPRLVYATITGFGPDGPVAEQVSIDGPVQAFAGSIELAELNGVELMPMPITVADIAGASSATQGVLGALLARERTGEGCHVDVSLFEAVLPWINVNRRAALAPPVTLIVEGRDGGRFIVQTPIHFHGRLLQLAGSVAGCEALADDPRFATREAARDNAEEYTALMRKAFATATRDEWLARLKEAGIPAGPVHSIDEALAHPQLDHRGAVAEVTNVDGTTARISLSPVRFDGQRRDVVELPPALGAHTAEVLRELLGYDDSDLEKMARAGAFGPGKERP